MRWMRLLLSVLFLCLCFSGCGYRELQERILIQAIGVDQIREGYLSLIHIWTAVAAHYTPLTAYSFMIFNLLCAPCFAAMGAIKREMNNWKWTLGAIGYMCGLAYVVSFIVYQIGSLFVGGGFGVGTVIAILAVIAIVYLLVSCLLYTSRCV